MYKKDKEWIRFKDKDELKVKLQEKFKPFGELRFVATNDLKPDPEQPRKNFDEEDLKSLAKTIRENGIISPLIIDENNKIIIGERRWRACKLAGVNKIPCIVKDVQNRLLVQLIEDVQKKHFNPIERANALRKLIESTGLSLRKASKLLGMSRWKISDHLALLDLPNEVQERVSSGEIPYSLMVEATKVPEEKRDEFIKKITEKKLTHKQIRTLRKVYAGEKEYPYVREIIGAMRKLLPLLQTQKVKKLSYEERMKIFDVLEGLYQKLSEFYNELKGLI